MTSGSFWSWFTQGWVLWALCILLLVGCGTAGTWLYLKATTALQPTVRNAQNHSAANQRDTDAWFANVASDIQTAKANLATAKEQLDQFNHANPDPAAWTYTQKEQYTELTQNVDLWQTQLAKDVNDYNARVKNWDYCSVASSQYLVLYDQEGTIAARNVACPPAPGQ